MVDYFEELTRSFKEMFQQPVLLVPFLAQALVTVLFGLLLLVGSAALLMPIAGIDMFAPPETWTITWTPQLISWIVGILAVDLLLLLVVGAWFLAGGLAMINEAADGRKPAGFFAGAAKQYGRVLRFLLLKTALFFVAAIPFLIVAFFFVRRIIQPGFMFSAQDAGIIILLVVCFLVFIGLASVLLLGLFFSQVILIREETGAWQSIILGFRLLKDETSHVLWSALTVAVATLVLSFGLALLVLPFQIASDATGNPALSFLTLLASLVRIVLQVAVSVALLLFTFTIYRVQKGETKATLEKQVRKIAKGPRPTVRAKK